MSFGQVLPSRSSRVRAAGLELCDARWITLPLLVHRSAKESLAMAEASFDDETNKACKASWKAPGIDGKQMGESERRRRASMLGQAVNYGKKAGCGGHMDYLVRSLTLTLTGGLGPSVLSCTVGMDKKTGKEARLQGSTRCPWGTGAHSEKSLGDPPLRGFGGKCGECHMMPGGVGPTGYRRYRRGLPFRYYRSNRGPPHHCSSAQMEFGTRKGKAGASRRCDSNWIGRERGEMGRAELWIPYPTGGAPDTRLDVVISR